MNTMKHALYAGLALVALAACSQDETTDVNKTDAISFRTSLSRATRAATTLENMDSFNVTAVPMDDEKNKFTDLEVKKDGDTWNTSSIHYWPLGGLEFTAYAPISLKDKVTIDHKTQKISGFEVEQTVKEQKDVVVAFNEGSKEDFGVTGVPMNFKHALAQIQVKATCKNSNLRVKVVGVKLGNIKSKGDFTFPQTETKSDYRIDPGKWTSLSELKSFMVESRDNEGIILDNTAQNIMFGPDNFMMIPQKLTEYKKTTASDGAYIAVLCRIDSNDGKGNFTAIYPSKVETEYAFAAVGIDADWLPGTKYTYTLEFGSGVGESGGAGIVPPDQKNPNSGGHTVTIPQKPFPSLPGEHIMQNAIKFSVSVENWVEQGQKLPM